MLVCVVTFEFLAPVFVCTPETELFLLESIVLFEVPPVFPPLPAAKVEDEFLLVRSLLPYMIFVPVALLCP